MSGGRFILLVIAVGFFVWATAASRAPEDHSVESIELSGDVVPTAMRGVGFGISGMARHVGNRNITEIQVRMWVEDCDDQNSCVTVGEQTGRHRVWIPPQQVRRFVISDRGFPDAPLRPIDGYTRHYRWQVVDVRYCSSCE
jgi:hypothetical protein